MACPQPLNRKVQGSTPCASTMSPLWRYVRKCWIGRRLTCTTLYPPTPTSSCALWWRASLIAELILTTAPWASGRPRWPPQTTLQPATRSRSWSWPEGWERRSPNTGLSAVPVTSQAGVDSRVPDLRRADRHRRRAHLPLLQDAAAAPQPAERLERRRHQAGRGEPLGQRG